MPREVQVSRKRRVARPAFSEVSFFHNHSSSNRLYTYLLQGNCLLQLATLACCNLFHSHQRKKDLALESVSRRLKNITNQYWSDIRQSHGNIVAHAIGKMARDQLVAGCQYKDWRDCDRKKTNLDFVDDCVYPLTAGGLFVREFCDKRDKPFPPEQVTLGSVFSGGYQEDRVMEVDGATTMSVKIRNAGASSSGFADFLAARDESTPMDDTLEVTVNPNELFPDQLMTEEDDREDLAEMEADEDEVMDARFKIFGGGKPWKEKRASPKKSPAKRRRRRRDHRREAEKCKPMYH